MCDSNVWEHSWSLFIKTLIYYSHLNNVQLLLFWFVFFLNSWFLFIFFSYRQRFCWLYVFIFTLDVDICRHDTHCYPLLYRKIDVNLRWDEQTTLGHQSVLVSWIFTYVEKITTANLFVYAPFNGNFCYWMFTVFPFLYSLAYTNINVLFVCFFNAISSVFTFWPK